MNQPTPSRPGARPEPTSADEARWSLSRSIAFVVFVSLGLWVGLAVALTVLLG